MEMYERKLMDQDDLEQIVCKVEPELVICDEPNEHFEQNTTGKDQENVDYMEQVVCKSEEEITSDELNADGECININQDTFNTVFIADIKCEPNLKYDELLKRDPLESISAEIQSDIGKSIENDKTQQLLRSHDPIAEKSELDEDLRTHYGEKLYPCNFCAKMFANKQHLNIHMRIHTGEKPYSCTFCSKMFADNSNCDRHMKTHVGQKLFECKCCAKKFLVKSDLNRHMRTHTGEKPFSCRFCERRFTDNSNRDRHMRTHTGEKPFTCEFCTKLFTQKSSVNKHIVRAHAVMSERCS